MNKIVLDLEFGQLELAPVSHLQIRTGGLVAVSTVCLYLLDLG